MKQFVKELCAITLLLVSILWIMGTAGLSDLEKIGIGGCIVRLAIGLAMLYVSVLCIGRLIKEGTS